MRFGMITIFRRTQYTLSSQIGRDCQPAFCDFLLTVLTTSMFTLHEPDPHLSDALTTLIITSIFLLANDPKA